MCSQDRPFWLGAVCGAEGGTGWPSGWLELMVAATWFLLFPNVSWLIQTFFYLQPLPWGGLTLA